MPAGYYASAPRVRNRNVTLATLTGGAFMAHMTLKQQGCPGTTMHKVLIVEDELDLQQILEFNLRQAGFEVLTAPDAATALKTCQQQAPDLVLLDLMLPDLPGTHVLQRLRTDPRTRSLPVIMLTARGEEADRVLGLELGADDYIVKPFSLRELLLRIQAVLRRHPVEAEFLPAPSAISGGTAGEADQLLQGDLRVDRATHRVFVESREVKLTALEFRLLWTLTSAKGRVLSRTDLLNQAWKTWNTTGGITTRTVDTHIKRLREKIGRAGERIETVRGVGYRFVPETEAP